MGGTAVADIPDDIQVKSPAVPDDIRVVSHAAAGVPNDIRMVGAPSIPNDIQPISPAPKIPNDIVAKASPASPQPSPGVTAPSTAKINFAPDYDPAAAENAVREQTQKDIQQQPMPGALGNVQEMKDAATSVGHQLLSTGAQLAEHAARSDYTVGPGAFIPTNLTLNDPEQAKAQDAAQADALRQTQVQENQQAAQADQNIHGIIPKFVAEQAVPLGIPAAASAIGLGPVAFGAQGALGYEQHARGALEAQGASPAQSFNAAAPGEVAAGAAGTAVGMIPGGTGVKGVAQAAGSMSGLDAVNQVAEILATGKPLKDFDIKQNLGAAAFGTILHGGFTALHTMFNGNPPQAAVDQVSRARTPEEVQAAVESARQSAPQPQGNGTGQQPVQQAQPAEAKPAEPFIPPEAKQAAPPPAATVEKQSENSTPPPVQPNPTTDLDKAGQQPAGTVRRAPITVEPLDTPLDRLKEVQSHNDALTDEALQQLGVTRSQFNRMSSDQIGDLEDRANPMQHSAIFQTPDYSGYINKAEGIESNTPGDLLKGMSAENWARRRGGSQWQNDVGKLSEDQRQSLYAMMHAQGFAGEQGWTNTKQSGALPGETTSSPAQGGNVAERVPGEGEKAGEAAAGGEQQATTTGIAHRVNEAKGLNIPAGQGIGAEESVKLGRQEYAAIGGADKVAEWPKGDAPPDQKIRVARAHAEFLDQQANAAADKNGINSPEYQTAAKAARDWKADVIKPMSTEAHRGFVAHQGETEIDTGTFHGIASAYQEAKGKEMTPGETAKAQRFAAAAKSADAATEAAGKRITAAVDQHVASNQSPAIKSLADRIVAKLDTAADAAWERFKARNTGTTLRSGIDPADVKDLAIYGAAKIAKGLTKFADWSADMVKDVGESIRPHLQTIWDAADKHLDEHIASQSPKAQAENLKNSIRKTPVDLSAHPPGTKMTPERVKALWEKAKSDYIDKGNVNFSDIANKMAVDTGLPVNDVRRALGAPKSIRQITNDMYAAQSRRRSVDQQAKGWIRNAGTPLPMRVAKGVPGAFFSAKVFGHGTVGMITHAGNQMFDPVVARQYWTNFARQFKFVSSSAGHERAMQDLETSPNFVTARRAGLANDPGVREEYQGGLLGKLKISGGRGFDALKTMRQDLFDRAWDNAPASLKTPEYAKELANTFNHATGYGANPAGTGTWGKIATVGMFAPRLEGSRWSFLLGDPAKAAMRLATWKNQPPEMRSAAIVEVRQKATIVATYMLALAANQGILSATGSKDRVNFADPSKSDWLDFKVAGYQVGIISPMKNTVKFFVNMAQAAIKTRTGSNGKLLKDLHGESVDDEQAGGAKKYLRGKLSPFGSVVADVDTHHDYDKRPMPWSSEPVPKYLQQQGVGKYGYGEYLTQTFLPIPAEEAMKEVWRSQGVNDSTAKRWLRAIGVAAVAGTTGVRINDETGR